MTQIEGVLDLLGSLFSLLSMSIFGIPFYVLIVVPFVFYKLAEFMHGRR